MRDTDVLLVPTRIPADPDSWDRAEAAIHAAMKEVGRRRRIAIKVELRIVDTLPKIEEGITSVVLDDLTSFFEQLDRHPEIVRMSGPRPFGKFIAKLRGSLRSGSMDRAEVLAEIGQEIKREVRSVADDLRMPHLEELVLGLAGLFENWGQHETAGSLRSDLETE